MQYHVQLSKHASDRLAERFPGRCFADTKGRIARKASEAKPGETFHVRTAEAEFVCVVDAASGEDGSSSGEKSGVVTVVTVFGRGKAKRDCERAEKRTLREWTGRNRW
jgi:hypothetical protein